VCREHPTIGAGLHAFRERVTVESLDPSSLESHSGLKDLYFQLNEFARFSSHDV